MTVSRKVRRAVIALGVVAAAGCGKDPCGNLNKAIAQARSMKGCDR